MNRGNKKNDVILSYSWMEGMAGGVAHDQSVSLLHQRKSGAKGSQRTKDLSKWDTQCSELCTTLETCL